MEIPSQLICPAHGLPLLAATLRVEDATHITCEAGCVVPVVNGIPRFVESNNYANAFGLQWKHFRKTQLDSYSGTTITRDRMQRCFGGSFEILHGADVLEAGCGAGRFTEILLAEGAHLTAADLSVAVEANYENHGAKPNYFVMQADIQKLPVRPHSYDAVVCLGVIQHTSNSEETIAALAGYVKPGGTLIIDHYSYEAPSNWTQTLLRKRFIKMQAEKTKGIVFALGKVFLPFHRLFWNRRRGSKRARRLLRKFSPMVDYFEQFPELNRAQLAEWSVLDTHDLVTDFYKHLRNVEEIRNALVSLGMTDIKVWTGGNGVEAIARWPVSDTVSGERNIQEVAA